MSVSPMSVSPMTNRKTDNVKNETTKDNENTTNDDSMVVTLITSDGIRMQLTENEIQMSKVIVRLLTECSIDGEIPLLDENTNFETMKLISTYLKYHYQHPEEHEKYRGEDKSCNDVGEWDKKFISALSKDNLAFVCLASNYLEIEDLLNLCCKQIASVIKEKSEEEIREYFGCQKKETSIEPNNQMDQSN